MFVGWQNETTEMFTNSTIKIGNPAVKFVPHRKEETGLLNVKVEATEDSDCLCALVSIQNATCPYYDKIELAQRYVCHIFMKQNYTSIKITVPGMETGRRFLTCRVFSVTLASILTGS